MGHRNPDRISMTERRPGCETVEAMIQKRWIVKARCRTCGLEAAVDLWLVARVRGPQTSLLGCDVKRRRDLCQGRMVSEAKAPGMTHFDTLAGHPVKREPAWKRGRE